jgi:hypothetical protein
MEFGKWGNSISEGLAVLALSGAIGCAHTQGVVLYQPPRGMIALYPLEDGIRAERVDIGGELHVLAEADVRILRNGKVRDLAGHEARYGPANLTYCWFIFQDIGLTIDGIPLFMLLNPRYMENGQPRHIGAVVSVPDGKGMSVDVVLPLKHDEYAPQDSGWELPPLPRSREGYLFLLKTGTFMPMLDDHALRRLPNYCKETALPEYAVVEYGQTFPVLAVYPRRE